MFDDLHELIDKVVAKVCKMGEIWCNFCEVSNCHWAFDTQAIRFNKDSFPFEPFKKLVLFASKFDAA